MLELLIAWRYIRSKRKEKMISAIAVFSFFGIALGVATLIIVTSVMNGFSQEFTNKIIGFNGHLSLNPNNASVNYKDVASKISKIQDVKSVVCSLERQVILSDSKTVKGSLSVGISYDDLLKKELISKNIVSGSLKNFKEEDSIILGDNLAKKSRVSLGDNIVLFIPEIEMTGFGAMPRKKTFKLVATFKSGMYEYDNNISFINLNMAQILFKMHDRINCISVFVKNPLRIENSLSTIMSLFKNDFYISDWQQNNSSFMNAVKVERNVMFLILTLIIIVASFNIIACMIMLVKDKEKEIAILRTIGMLKSSILKIFLFIGGIIGGIGTIIGCIFGVLFSANIVKIQHAIEYLLRAQIFSPEVYFLTHLPSVLRTSDVVLITTISLLLSCVATFYPSRKASKLNPTEILRYA